MPDSLAENDYRSHVWKVERLLSKPKSKAGARRYQIDGDPAVDIRGLVRHCLWPDIAQSRLREKKRVRRTNGAGTENAKSSPVQG